MLINVTSELARDGRHFAKAQHLNPKLKGRTEGEMFVLGEAVSLQASEVGARREAVITLMLKVLPTVDRYKVKHTLIFSGRLDSQLPV